MPMTPGIVIRDEMPADIDAIASVTLVAFKTLEISNHTEQFIVAALRAAGRWRSTTGCRRAASRSTRGSWRAPESGSAIVLPVLCDLCDKAVCRA
ncbi:MAG: hypothetical protein AB1443_00760 [Pseudomonadota bacterium]